MFANFTYFFKDLFWPRLGVPLYPEIFPHYNTLILQRIRIIVGDAGFEPWATTSPILFLVFPYRPGMLLLCFKNPNLHCPLWAINAQLPVLRISLDLYVKYSKYSHGSGDYRVKNYIREKSIAKSEFVLSSLWLVHFRYKKNMPVIYSLR